MTKTANKITALYCRTAQSSPFGIEHQKQLLLHYAQDRGLGPDDVAFFIDDGFSGTTLDRPAFQRMLSGIRAGEVGEVVTKDEPRYGRNCLEVHELARDLREQYGVKLLTVMDGDFFQAHDGLVTALLRADSKGGARK